MGTPLLTIYASAAITAITPGHAVTDNGSASFHATTVTQAIRGIALAPCAAGRRPQLASVGDDVPFVAGVGGAEFGETLVVESGTGKLVALTTVTAGMHIVGTCTMRADADATGRIRLLSHGLDTVEGIGVVRNNSTSSTHYGTDPLALQAAIGDSSPGDHIIVHTGQYYGPITIPIAVEVSGTSRSMIVSTGEQDTVTMEEGGILRSCITVGPVGTILIPSTKAAIRVIGDGSRTLLQNVSHVGQGGQDGVVFESASGTGVFSIIGLYHIDGVYTHAAHKWIAGRTQGTEISYQEGESGQFMHFSGGSSVTFDSLCFVPTGGAVETGILIDGGNHRIRSLGVNNTTTGICIDADGVELRIGGGGIGAGVATHFKVKAGLTGAGTAFVMDGRLDTTKFEVSTTWRRGALSAGFYIDTDSEGDEAVNFASEVRIGDQIVPREFIVGGDSYVAGMSVWTWDGVSVWDDVTPELSSLSASTATWPQTIEAGLYITSKVEDVADFFDFPGIKTTTDTALNSADASNLVFEFYVSGDPALNSSWEDLAVMCVDSSAKSRAKTFGHTPFERASADQVHFNSLLELDLIRDAAGVSRVWGKCDPMGTGTSSYVIRIRNKNALANPAPLVQQIKLYPIGRFEVEGNGERHSYGNARAYTDLSFNIGSAAKAPVYSPTNQPLYYSGYHALGIEENNFVHTAVKRRTWDLKTPLDCDTSSGVHVTIAGRPAAATGGVMVWNIYVGRAPKDGPLYAADPGGHYPHEHTQRIEVTVPAVADQELRFVLSADIRHAVAQYADTLINDGDSLLITVERDTVDVADTFGAALGVVDVTARYFGFRA